MTMECTDKWYTYYHQPYGFITAEVGMTWDMTIFTDKRLKHNRPDITVVKKYIQEWILIEQCWASGPKYPCN